MATGEAELVHRDLQEVVIYVLRGSPPPGEGLGDGDHDNVEYETYQQVDPHLQPAAPWVR